jgi:hypothetical protein
MPLLPALLTFYIFKPMTHSMKIFNVEC